ncbi:MAG: ChaN family lipoprotein [Coleofasciculaceae cyanobacterium RL_1_1]|nr:ChaN family lipoprotein [Coleofasciculaceae cyanobacterium RL_1_1]
MLGIILSASIAHSEVTSQVTSDIRPPESIAPLTRTALLDRLADAHVIYLGEYHDRAYDHQAQLEIIRELQARNPKLTIAMEMFQRPFQGAINAYLAGEIDETDLIDRTEYETRWGYPWELYAPILRFAREAGIPVIAANAPMELTRKVAAAGLAGLSGEDFRDVPPWPKFG